MHNDKHALCVYMYSGNKYSALKRSLAKTESDDEDNEGKNACINEIRFIIVL